MEPPPTSPTSQACLAMRETPASGIGSDALGDEALQRLTELGLSTAYVQRISAHPTGTVNVEIDSTGQPSFDIAESVAWDFLEWTQAWQQLAERADVVCFGSLAQRVPQSRATIRSFLLATRPDAIRIFDVNLRQNFYTAQILAESMQLATIVKLNHEELHPKSCICSNSTTVAKRTPARQLLSVLQLEAEFLHHARRRRRPLLVGPEESNEHPGIKIKVADTVGARRRLYRCARTRLPPRSLAGANQRNREPRWRLGCQPARSNARFDSRRSQTIVG